MITLDPSSASIMDDEAISVSIRIDDVSNLYGADVRLSFDPELLSVIDADEIQYGINLESGDILTPPYFTIYNTADNTTGEIKYALTQLHPAEPFSGSGVLAVIHFQAQKAGVSDLLFNYIKLADGNGMEIPASSISGSITINSSNHAPVITESDPQTIVMSEDGTPIAFDLTLHASDEDVEDTLTWSISSSVSNGTATASGTGETKIIGYTPNANYYGADSFDVEVSDGKDTDTITVNVSIEAVNDAPVITEGDTTGVIMTDIFDLTLHATDIDGDDLTWGISTQANHGTASVDDTPGLSKVIGYAPVAGYFGDDSFVMLVKDNYGGEDTILVNVTINPAEPSIRVFLPVLIN
ncbi:MAG: cadherin-like domain-containing protein [Anaerolineales bacterium]|nr:cadherin-like domain-containing protein [Anaerolineales bacterium]